MKTFVRTIEAETIDRINGALDNLATGSAYYRPVPIESPLDRFAISTRSYSEVETSVDVGCDCQATSNF